jgi:predicted nucleotidyltransferase
MSRKSVDELASEIVDRVRRATDADRIILFGSRARGEAGTGSDFDILIVAPSELSPWTRTVPVYRLLSGIPASVDLVWWTPEEVEEWRGVDSHFINRALREGKVLYEKRAA